MKTKLTFLFISLLFVCKVTSGQDTISIADERNGNSSKVTIIHKAKDVVISRIDIPDGGTGKFYMINMYRQENGKLRMYPFGTSASDDYDIATYKWTNDTTIIFKLIKTSDKKSESFRMSGNGNRSDLERK